MMIPFWSETLGFPLQRLLSLNISFLSFPLMNIIIKRNICNEEVKIWDAISLEEFPTGKHPYEDTWRIFDPPISSWLLLYHCQSFDFGSCIGWLSGHCLPLGNIIGISVALVGVVIFVVTLLDLLIFTMVYAVTFDVFTRVSKRLQNVRLKLL